MQVADSNDIFSGSGSFIFYPNSVSGARDRCDLPLIYICALVLANNPVILAACL